MSDVQDRVTVAQSMFRARCDSQMPSLRRMYQPDRPQYPGQAGEEYVPWVVGETHADGSVWLEDGTRRYPNGDTLIGGCLGRYHPSEMRYKVPDEYYQDVRSYGGHHVYRRATWTLFVRGQLLVLGPPLKRKRRDGFTSRHVGCLCMFDSITGGSLSDDYGYHGYLSTVLTADDHWVNFPSERLVPVEFCEQLPIQRFVDELYSEDF